MNALCDGAAPWEGSAAPFAYDLVDYPSHVRPQTHPSRLAAIARLHGLDTAAPSACRLLEVGCGDGGNLLPLAMAYPGARFVGIDLSAAAIARGEHRRERLGLPNLTLVQADLGAWDPGPERFDFIVAHGFYSWVPAPVREALLALCRGHLAPHGVAYVSYNALPGCHLRRMVWEMLRFHVRDEARPAQRLAMARAFLQSLAADVLSRKAYGQAVREEARQLLEETDPAVLFHDDLAEINEPLTVTEFVTAARRVGLEFLGEADYYESSGAVAPPPVAERLRALATPDVLLQEQHLDFLKGRRFRQTLLCRADAPLRREARAATVAGFDCVGQFEWPADTLDLAPGVAMQFREPLGAAISTDQPAVKAALVALTQAHPAPQTFTDLLATARARTGRDASTQDEDREALQQALLMGFQLGLLTLHCEAPRFAMAAGERPRASPLALAEIDAGADLVTSLRPSTVRLENPLTRELVRLLDGSRDRAALLQALAQRMASDPALGPPGAPMRPVDWWRGQLAPQIESGLAQAGRLALLVG